MTTGELVRQQEPDFEVANHGTIAMVYPLTPACHSWVEEHVNLEGWQWLGGGFACEPRTVERLIDGMQADGLVGS